MRPALRRKFMQPVWTSLHHLSLWGMNIGRPAGDVKESGEDWVLAECLRRSNPDRPFVLFDVGANVGQYASLALSVGGSRIDLYSFEPSISTFARLCANLADTPARLFNLGFSSEPRTATLFSHSGGEAEASLHCRDMAHWGITQSNTETIQLHRLDDFCREREIETIDFLKLDVEGHEGEVLDGAGELLRQARIRFVQFEFGAPNLESRTYFRDFFRRFAGAYDLYRVIYHGLEPVDCYSEFHETFLTVNYLAVRREN